MIYRGVPYTMEGEVRVYDCLQRSEQWDLLRMGTPTASEFDKVLTPITCKPSASAKKYAIQKVTEIFTQRPLKKDLMTRAMEYGNMMEADARRLYQMAHGGELREVGFMTDKDHMWGCSPDCLVDDDGDLEIKCPDADTQMEYMLYPEKLQKAYAYQAQGRMFIHGRKWADLWSYNPEMPPVHVHVERDDEYIGKLAFALDGFRKTMNDMIEILIEKGHLKIGESNEQ